MTTQTRNEPETEAGRDHLNAMRAVWGVDAWRSYPWENDVLAIEAEARRATVERIRERLDREIGVTVHAHDEEIAAILDEEAAR